MGKNQMNGQMIKGLLQSPKRQPVDQSSRTLVRDCDEVTELKWRPIHGHVCVLIPTSLLAQLHG